MQPAILCEGRDHKEAEISGPKGYDVALQAQLRRQRELAARRRTWAEMVSQLAELQGRIQVSGAQFDVWSELSNDGFDQQRISNPTEADLDAIAEFVTARATVAAAATVHVNRAQSERALRDLDSLHRKLTKKSTVALTRTLVGGGETVASEHAPAWESPAGRLIELLGQTGDQVELLTAAVENLADSDKAADRRAWLELTRRITDAVRAEADRVGRFAVIDELIAMTARVEGPARTVLIARIQAAPTRAKAEALRGDIVDAIAEAEREAERALIIAQAAEVWTELGYDVGPEFLEAAELGSAGLLFNPEWPDHALQVRFDGSGGTIATNIIAFGDTDPQRDKEIEDDHCRDLPAFIQGLNNLGASVTLVRQQPAGALPVQRLGRGRKRADQRTTEETRHLS